MTVAIQPAGSPESRTHYADTVARPVDVALHAQLLEDEQRANLLSVATDGRIALWGVTPGKGGVNSRKYQRLRVGDLVLFTRDKKVFVSGRIGALLENPALARALWGELEDGQTWQHMYALVDLTERDISYERLRAALGYDSGDNFMGFRVLDQAKSLAAYRLVDEEPNYAPWTLHPGEEILRKTLHERFGGGRYGGIEPSAQTPNIFLFTHPSVGARYGYSFDGPQEDGGYHYTGDGQVGDQDPDEGGNRAILGSVESGRSLRLFESTSRSGWVRYLGEYVLGAPPYHFEVAPDLEGAQRRVVVFHLDPLGDQADSSSQIPFAPEFALTDTERSHRATFTRTIRPGVGLSERREIQLQQRFETWLGEQGIACAGAQLRLEGAAATLRPDLVLPAQRFVVEAKSSTARGHVRTAVGQVLDYVFHIERISGDHYTPAVLLPGRPDESLCDLLRHLDIALYWPDGSGFSRL